MGIRQAAWLGMVLLFGSVYGADENQQFAIKGIGLGSCAQFVEARNAQSNKYFQYGGWMNGYLSATNRYEKNTFDIAPWQSTGLLAGWVAQVCEQHPELPFVRAVGLLVNKLGDQRLKSRSELVKIQEGDETIHLYAVVLQQVQAKLAELGHYQGEADGEFGPGTKAALARYQQEEDLPVTGLPDQRTLAKLL